MSKLVFITGASSGIGQALAWRFYEAGYSLALVARRGAVIDAWLAQRAMDLARCKVYSADVSQANSIIASAQQCMASQGIPDVVIANAGISVGVDSAIRSDLETMARIFATNNLGMAHTFHPFLAPCIGRRSGVFVGIASVAGIRGLAGHGAYCASKAAVIAYCESLRGELRATGVRVVTLLPGYVDTPLTRRNAYAMPFLMDADAFADQALNAIERGDSYRVIPWQMHWVAKVLRLLPNRVFDLLMAGQPRKSRGE